MQGSSPGDLHGGDAHDWLVTGWFTPDYRPLAEKFAANLAQHDAPFHLWARPKVATGWNTRQKPSVVLDAMDAYPGKTIVLMDVDCVVRGDMSPVADITGDVGITVQARNMRRHGWKWYNGIAVECSSRVVVFRPTDNARAFANEWAKQVEESAGPHNKQGMGARDERCMAWAFVRCANVDFSFIDRRYSGRDASVLPDAVICHSGAHGEQERREMGQLKKALNLLKIFERPFRTGRSKLRKQLQSG